MNTTSKKTQFSYLDEDDMVSNSAIKVPTQQSVKAYVDTTAEGLHVLEAVNAATTGNITLSNQQTIDGVGVVAGNRVLVKDQSTSSENGIYTCVDGGSWTRTSDFSSSPDVRLSDFVFCSAGTVNDGHGFVMTGSTNFTTTGYAADGTTPAGTVGTHDIVFTQFSGVSSTVPVSKGGTGQTSYTNGQLLIGNTTGNTLAKGLIEAGGGITVTNSAGGIKIDANFTGSTTVAMTTYGSGLKAYHTTGLSATTTITQGSILAANSENVFSVIDGTTSDNHSAEAADKVLFWDATDDTISWNIIENVCFLKGTKITLPDKSQKNIEDLSIGELVLTYQIKGLSNLNKDQKHEIMNWSEKSMGGTFQQNRVKNIWVNPIDRYLVINDKLKITNLHIIHVKRGEEYKFLPAEKAQFNDLLLTDKGEYEPITEIQQIHERVEVYNIEVKKDKTYFAENYLVHNFCETCSGLSGRI